MSQAQRYGVYTAWFPFLEASEGKVRPVIVMSDPQGRHSIVAVIPITSVSQHEPVDTVIKDWQGAGLIRPSVARVHRLTTMLQADLLSELGRLTSSDIKRVQTSVRSFLDV